MKIINRMAERVGAKEISLVFEDPGCRLEVQAEVLVCPLSYDVEVWMEGACYLKLFVNACGGGSIVGLSWFLKQPPMGKELKRIVRDAKRMKPIEAAHKVKRYAEQFARELEAKHACKPAAHMATEQDKVVREPLLAYA